MAQFEQFQEKGYGCWRLVAVTFLEMPKEHQVVDIIIFPWKGIRNIKPGVSWDYTA